MKLLLLRYNRIVQKPPLHFCSMYNTNFWNPDLSTPGSANIFACLSLGIALISKPYIGRKGSIRRIGRARFSIPLLQDIVRYFYLQTIMQGVSKIFFEVLRLHLSTLPAKSPQIRWFEFNMLSNRKIRWKPETVYTYPL